MAKFHGRVGFGEPAETSPGVHEDVIVEREYFGDVIRNSRSMSQGENLNQDISVNNSISVVADTYAVSHMFAIRYVEWAGSLWTVTTVDVEAPRLILQIGEVYNGPTAA
jgi:hypothetical protein